jgi:hypothetical protein
MTKSVSSYRIAKNLGAEDSSPLNNPLSYGVVDDLNSQDLKIYKTTTTTEHQQEETIPCELSTGDWECDYSRDDNMLSESELFDHIKTREHIKGMIDLLAMFGVEGSARHKLPTTYPHQTDHTIIHIKECMSEKNKEGINNWGGFIKWYIEHIATEFRPTFRAQTTPFQPKTNQGGYLGNRW